LTFLERLNLELSNLENAFYGGVGPRVDKSCYFGQSKSQALRSRDELEAPKVISRILSVTGTRPRRLSEQGTAFVIADGLNVHSGLMGKLADREDLHKDRLMAVPQYGGQGPTSYQVLERRPAPVRPFSGRCEPTNDEWTGTYPGGPPGARPSCCIIDIMSMTPQCSCAKPSSPK